MDRAESGSRKGRAAGAAADKLAFAARLGALEKNLGVPVSRNRSVGNISNTDPTRQHSDAASDKDEVVVLGKPF